jgi:hypothetical protein
MYRDITQWSGIRDRVLRKGVSIRQVARETGISPETIRKMVDHPLPLPYLPRSRSYPSLGPHTGSIQRMPGAQGVAPEIKFAGDSLLEERRFELSVPPYAD